MQAVGDGGEGTKSWSIATWSIAMRTAIFQVLATSGYSSVNRMSQSDSRIQILLQLDWMARFSLLQPDVARTWKNVIPLKNRNTYVLLLCPSAHMFQQTGDKEGEEVE